MDINVINFFLLGFLTIDASKLRQLAD